jgi:carbonic anhydrase/acetyltransferase-like protein (isoleucine patch superfamily)
MIIEYKGKRPQIAANVYVAPTAVIIGDVVIGEGASVWFGAVIRGDSGPIRIGAGTNVQDNVVVHVNSRHATLIGDNVTIGHGAVLEGCTIGAGSLIGMNATVLDGAVVGEGAAVAAGALVREGQTIPPHTLAAGVPAKVRGLLSAEVQARLSAAPGEYRRYAQTYRDEEDR